MPRNNWHRLPSDIFNISTTFNFAIFVKSFDISTTQQIAAPAEIAVINKFVPYHVSEYIAHPIHIARQSTNAVIR